MKSSRRIFLRHTTFSLAAGVLYGRQAQQRCRYVAASDAIHVSVRHSGRWIVAQTVPCRSPTALTWDLEKRSLYVANEIDDHDGLPRGTVEAYAVDLQTGRLTLLTRQPLSLSATRPRSLALSPDNRHIVVAAYGGGSYNVLPIERDGALARVSSIMKETGSSVDPEHQTSAHPHSLIFDRTGRYLLSTDFGCDRVNVFRLVNGALVRHQRLETVPGSGPGALAFDQSGTLVYVRNELRGSISSYPFRPATGQIEQPVAELPLANV